MLTATFRGMVAHKLRLVLTTASIALGVAFLAGTLVLTDTMGLAFEQLFGKVSAGTDAVVRTEASFTQSEGNPRKEEAGDRAHQRMAGGGGAPGRDRDAIAEPRTKPVDEPTEGEHPHGIGRLEGRVDLAELGVGPVQLIVEDRLDQREDLPVDVVDGCRGEQERADDPAITTGEEGDG